MVQQATNEFTNQVRAQGPRGVDVTKRRCHVWHTAVTNTPVSPGLGEVDLLAINEEVHVAHRYKLQARCRDDNVGVEMVA